MVLDLKNATHKKSKAVDTHFKLVDPIMKPIFIRLSVLERIFENKVFANEIEKFLISMCKQIQWHVQQLRRGFACWRFQHRNNRALHRYIPQRTWIK